MLAHARDRIAVAFLVAITTLAPSPFDVARAQCPADADGCHEEGVAFHWREGFLDSVMLDSGWVPSGSPLQVRFALFIGGETEIDLAGTSFTWWPSPLSVSVPGTPGSGFLSIDYGIEFVARVRFDVEVAGVRYTWEGDIPTGPIPRDLRVAAMRAFDSMLLPPQMPRPVMIEDTTERFAVIDADLAGMIGIPGVSGGFVVDIEGALAASYQTDRIEIGDAPSPITEEGAATVAGPDSGETDFGASKDVVIQPVGHLDYDGTVTLYPAFYIEVLGRRFDLGLGALPVPVADIGREVRFDPATVHVPLPDVVVMPRELDFGEVDVGRIVSQTLEIRNEGEAPLSVTPRLPRLPFSIATDEIIIPPASSRTVDVYFAPERAELTEAMLFLETTDPDESLVVIRLSGRGIGEVVADGGVGDDGGTPELGGLTGGGCACRVGVGRGGAGAGSMWTLAIGLTLALVIRRRRGN